MSVAATVQDNQDAQPFTAINQQVVELKKRLFKFNHELNFLAGRSNDEQVALLPPQTILFSENNFKYQYSQLLLSHELFAEAAEQLRALLDEQIDTKLRDAATALLAEAVYSLEDYSAAEKLMWSLCDRLSATCSTADHLALMGKVLIKQKQGSRAAELINATRLRMELNDQQKLNIGVMLYNNDLQQLGLDLIKESSLDKAKIIAGNVLIEQGHLTKAMELFNNVATEGYLGGDALLGIGWLEYGVENYLAAVNAWSKASNKKLMSDELMAVYLLEPYAQWRMGMGKVAIGHYRDAVNIYQKEVEFITDAVSRVKETEDIKSIIISQGESIILDDAFINRSAGSNIIASSKISLNLDPELKALITYQDDLKQINDHLNAYLKGSHANNVERLRWLESEATSLIKIQNTLERNIQQLTKTLLIKRLEQRKKIIEAYHLQANYILGRILDKFSSRVDGDG